MSGLEEGEVWQAENNKDLRIEITSGEAYNLAGSKFSQFYERTHDLNVDSIATPCSENAMGRT